MHKEMRRAVQVLERQGFTTCTTGSGHVKITHPQMDGPVFASTSPSCYRALDNLRSMLRRKLRVDLDLRLR